MSKALRLQLLSVLGHSAALNMNFIAGPINVRGGGLAGVWIHVYTGRIGVRVGRVSKGGNAEYNRRRNEFIFTSSGYGRTDDQKAAMLHECVHAMNDAEGKSARYVEDEAAAYIAQLLYYRAIRGRTARDVYGSLLAPHEEKADEIADLMVHLPGWAVPYKDLGDLQDLILKHPSYAGISRSDPNGANGV